jgi:predicted nucleotidyltransferase
MSVQEVVGYAPKFIDLINLETNTFDTVSIDQIIKESGNDFPLLNEIFSIQEERTLRKPFGLGIDVKNHDIVPTFENLISRTDYVKKIHAILKILSEKLDTPIDIEFACDGESLYLLQSRPQSSSSASAAAIIPKDIALDKLLFSAKRHVSNGRLPDINYIVYVDPQNYSQHSDLHKLKAIGRAVGELNKILPKKKFILMGPGRWGSRDDIRLGVNVSYSDINNTSMLIEIARQKGNYVPDLSFGTHFFQDLVEASIRYLPLFPDDEGVVFNEEFFLKSNNLLSRLLPEYADLSNTVKVINVPENTKGLVLRVLMNGDEEVAVGVLSNPSVSAVYSTSNVIQSGTNYKDSLQWRLHMVESIAAQLEEQRFGIKGLYLFGTTFSGQADSNSDIDLLVHYDGKESNKKDAFLWFEGWNLSLSEINFYQTGYKLVSLLDVHFVTDEDLKTQKYFADLVNPKLFLSKKYDLKRKE